MYSVVASRFLYPHKKEKKNKEKVRAAGDEAESDGWAT